MFDHKIQPLDELVRLLGPRPRAKKVILCHGVFDIVHPGHLRHLMYAKGKADVLVASLTTDAHILKADHRPYVPQALRAHNLAALEMVDWVLIDPDPTAVGTIRRLEPDYFAKGYEYVAEVSPTTQAESEVVIRLDAQDDAAHISSAWPMWSRRFAKRFGRPTNVSRSAEGVPVPSGSCP